MNNLFVSLCLVLVFTILIFVVAVFFVTLFKHCSVEDATKICCNFLKAIWSVFSEKSPKQEISFPVLIGWNGNRWDLLFVNDRFKKICEQFSVCYCSKVNNSPNEGCVAYQFEIQRKSDGESDEILEQLIQKQAEEVTAKHMMLYDCYISAESLVFAEIIDNRLFIAIATNKNGMERIAHQKMRLYHKRMHSHNDAIGKPKTFSTSWKDDAHG